MWQNGEKGEVVTSMTAQHASNALVVISTQEDYEAMNQATDGRDEYTMAKSTEDTVYGKMQEEEYAVKIDLHEDESPVDKIQAILAKYEIPIGLTAKLFELESYDLLGTCLHSLTTCRFHH
jgi:hypothetical protein